MYSFFSFEFFSQTNIFNKLGPCLLCRVDLGFTTGDWVRAVHIAFWDSVTAFSFQKQDFKRTKDDSSPNLFSKIFVVLC